MEIGTDHPEYDPWHHIPIVVEILDTKTGEIVTSKLDGFGTYWWTEGNGSCDCNRQLAFDNEEDNDTGCCLGCHRYLIKSFTPNIAHLTLADFNENYPPELIAQYLPQ